MSFVIFYIILLLFLLLYLIGPRPFKPVKQMSYEDAIAALSDASFGYSITRKSLMREIALSPLFPDNKQRRLLANFRILRILYLISIIAIWFGHDNHAYEKFALLGYFLFVSALLFRSFVYKSLGKAIVEESAKNRAIYDIVAMTSGWDYPLFDNEIKS